MLHIDIWTDFACPACYLAKPRIDQAIAASGHADAITVTHRSLELFPDAGSEPFDSFAHVLHKFGGDQAQAARLEEHMAALARAQGQPYAIHHPVASSFDAHRMLHLAAEHGAAGEFMDAVQRDLLGEGVNVYTAAYLANAATRAGVPAARAKALLAGDEYANAVRADDKLARELGVTARWRWSIRPCRGCFWWRLWNARGMPRYVALLRGINVGRRNRVAMADLRQLTEALGHTEVATYIQSGNVLFTSPDTDCGALADALEQAIARSLTVRPAVVVLSRAGLAQVIADNPFPDEADPRCLHAVFRRLDLAPEAVAAVEAAQQRARAKGSRDEAVPVGRALFLRTPDGLGRSELAAQLARSGAQADGTARNWATVTRLMAMLDSGA
jgi:uncharacterized protein (DUF1697 family)/predicted DsbA family dithiol-disulfide isomerase